MEIFIKYNTQKNKLSSPICFYWSIHWIVVEISVIANSFSQKTAKTHFTIDKQSNLSISMTVSPYFPLKTQIILYHSFLHLHSQSLFISPSSSLPLPNSRLLPTSSSSHFNLFSIFSFRIRNTWDFNHQFEKNKKLTEFSILPAVIFCGFLIWNIQMNWDKNEVNLWWVLFYVSFFANQMTENEI